MGDKRYEIKFEYADSLSGWNWRTQSCSVCAKDTHDAIIKCKRIYGLGIDCDYEILSVREV